MSSSGQRDNFSVGPIKNRAYTITFQTYFVNVFIKKLNSNIPTIRFNKAKSNYFEVHTDVNLSLYSSVEIIIETLDETPVINKIFLDTSVFDSSQSIEVALSDVEVSALPLGRFTGRAVLINSDDERVVSSEFAFEIY